MHYVRDDGNMMNCSLVIVLFAIPGILYLCELKKPAIILEFKVLDQDEENGLADTVQSALRQIEDKHYDAELIERGIARDDIKHYGFAFEGKKVLIGK